MGRCTANTKSGNKCRNRSLPGTSYCHIKAHRSAKQENIGKRTGGFIRDHWIAIASLIASIVTIVAFIFYLRDKKTEVTTGLLNKKIEATTGVLNAPTSGEVKYLSVGTTRFVIASPDNVFLRDGESPVLSLRLVENRLLVSTTIRNAKGDIIAELRDNEWQLNKDSIFDRNYTDNALEVRDRQGKITLQAVHFGDTIHLAGIFRCKNGWTTVLGPVEGGAVMDIKPPGEEAQYDISAICEYPSERHLSSCPGIEYLRTIVRHGDGPAYLLGGSLDLCDKPSLDKATRSAVTQ
jgi:hypothetical protein